MLLLLYGGRLGFGLPGGVFAGICLYIALFIVGINGILGAAYLKKLNSRGRILLTVNSLILIVGAIVTYPNNGILSLILGGVASITLYVIHCPEAVRLMDAGRDKSMSTFPRLK